MLTIASLPVLRDELSIKLPSVYRSGIKSAELWWVTADMAKLAVKASATFPRDAVLADFLPAMNGLIAWEGKNIIAVSNSEGHPIYPTGIVWSYTPSGLRLLAIVKNTKRLQVLRVDTPPAALEDPPTSGLYVDSGILYGFLASVWILSSQPGLGMRRIEKSSLRKSFIPRPHLPTVITVATLRELPKNFGYEKSGETAHTTVSVRFLVRGHWRNQACGPGRKMRKPVWVAPYVKGPKNAPFNPTELVKVWRR